MITTLLLDLLLHAAPLAQVSAGPMPIAPPPPIARPQDQAFHGTITLEVDATDTAHKVFSVSEHIPVQSPGVLKPRAGFSSDTDSARAVQCRKSNSA
jgi:hypothetical protein